MTRNLLTLVLLATIAVGCQQQPRTIGTPAAAPALRAGAIAATPYYPTLRGLPYFDPRRYGAQPGVSTFDSTTALNAAITAASAANGTVEGVPGLPYYVNLSGTTTYVTLKSNVTLRNLWLKRKPTVGQFEQMVSSGSNGSTAVSNVVLDGVTLDCDGPNNASVATANSGERQIAFKLFAVTNLTVRNCDFTGSGIWTCLVNGPACDDIAVVNSRLTFAPKSPPFAPDNSTGYIEAQGVVFTGNRINAATNAGARGGVEIHAGAASVSNNVIRNHETGINVVTQAAAVTPEMPANNIVVSNNCLYAVGNGIRCWPATGKTLRNVVINGNAIYINNADRASTSYMGIGTVLDTVLHAVDGDVEDLSINNNVIRLQPENRVTTTEATSGGIIIDSVGTVRGLSITGNRVRNSPLHGIRVNGGTNPVNDAEIRFNRVIDCGNNTSGTAGYRTAFTLSGTWNDSSAEFNTCVDTGSPNAKGSNFWLNSVTAGNGVIERGNMMRLTSTATSLGSNFTTVTGDEQIASAFTIGGNLSIDTRRGSRADLTISGATPAFSINLFGGHKYRQEFKVNIINSSGGAGPAITWSGFKLQGGAYTNPANGFHKVSVFKFDGTNWHEELRSADIAN